MTPALVSIIQLILAYGIPGAIQIIQTFSKTEITQADIDELKRLPTPESFFVSAPTIMITGGAK